MEILDPGLLKQGLILMATGLSAVFIFLIILVFVIKGFEFIAPKICHILPDPQPKPRAVKATGSASSNMALAIAVALKRAGK